MLEISAEGLQPVGRAQAIAEEHVRGGVAEREGGVLTSGPPYIAWGWAGESGLK